MKKENGAQWKITLTEDLNAHDIGVFNSNNNELSVHIGKHINNHFDISNNAVVDNVEYISWTWKSKFILYPSTNTNYFYAKTYKKIALGIKYDEIYYGPFDFHYLNNRYIKFDSNNIIMYVQDTSYNMLDNNLNRFNANDVKLFIIDENETGNIITYMKSFQITLD